MQRYTTQPLRMIGLIKFFLISAHKYAFKLQSPFYSSNPPVRESSQGPQST